MTTLSEIKIKVSALSTKQLKEMAIDLSNDFRDGVDIIYCEVLNAIELRMTESEFVKFCNAI